MQWFSVFLNMILSLGIHRTWLCTQSPRSGSHIQTWGGQLPLSITSLFCPVAQSGSTIARPPGACPCNCLLSLRSGPGHLPTPSIRLNLLASWDALVPPDNQICWTLAPGLLYLPLTTPDIPITAQVSPPFSIQTQPLMLSFPHQTLHSCHLESPLMPSGFAVTKSPLILFFHSPLKKKKSEYKSHTKNSLLTCGVQWILVLKKNH